MQVQASEHTISGFLNFGEIYICFIKITWFNFQLTEEPNGNTLVISLADENDAGDYICQVSTYKPTEIKHSVKIRGKNNNLPMNICLEVSSDKFCWVLLKMHTTTKALIEFIELSSTGVTSVEQSDQVSPSKLVTL